MYNTGKLWNSIVLTVIGAYMPFFNGSKDQIQLYVETLEQLQDIYLLNLFQIVLLVSPYNQNSLLLFDFLVSNELIVSDFCTKQSVNFKPILKEIVDHT